MKAIVPFIFLVLLTGCVSYPYTMYDDGQGVYYEDPVDVYGADATIYDSYLEYYPYWSMDYFYLGSGFGSPWYGYYYSPFFYPHYFAVWYPPWYWHTGYGHGPYWAWHNHYRHYQQVAYPSHRRSEPGVTGTGGIGDSSRINRAEPAENTAPAYRRTSFGSPGITSTGSMTVESPANGKVRPSRVGPTRSTGVNASVNPASRSVAPARSSAGTGRSSSRSPSTGYGSSGASSSGSASRSSRVERSRSSSTAASPARDRD